MTTRLVNRPQLSAVAAGLLMAASCGLIAGYSPLVGLGLAVAAVLTLGMVRDLAVGLTIFTVASFGSVLSLGHAATGAKAVGFLLILAWAATLTRRPRGEALALLREHRWLVIFAGALLAWSILSAAWAHSAGTALTGASRWAMDLVLIPVVYTGIRNLRQLRWVLTAFVAGAILAMLYGAATGTTVGGSRLASALSDPNETAAVMVASSVLALSLGAAERHSAKLRGLAYITGLAALVGLALTASRGGLVSLGVSLVAVVILAGRWRRKAAMAAGVCAVVVVSWFLLLAPASSRSHISNLQTGRTTLWLVAGRTIQANPVVGVGNDNFALTAGNYIDQPGVTTDAGQVIIDPHVAHNVYLEIWADLGVVGILLFAGMVVCAVVPAVRAARTFEQQGRWSEEIITRGIIVAIVAMLAADIFMSDLYSKQLFLLLALAPAASTLTRAGRLREAS